MKLTCFNILEMDIKPVRPRFGETIRKNAAIFAESRRCQADSAVL